MWINLKSYYKASPMLYAKLKQMGKKSNGYSSGRQREAQNLCKRLISRERERE